MPKRFDTVFFETMPAAAPDVPQLDLSESAKFAKRLLVQCAFGLLLLALQVVVIIWLMQSAAAIITLYK